MNIDDAKEGMKLRVNNDLSATKDKWTLDEDGDMLSMRGQLFEVYSVEESKNGIRLKGPHHHDTWIFCPVDLSIPEIIKPKPPVMFDPENL